MLVRGSRLAGRALAGPAARALPALRSLRTSSVRQADEAPKAVDGAMSFDFTLPSATLYSEAPVEMVILPGVDGQFGVMPNYVPTIAELKPGVIAVQETAGGPLTKYFVPGGFASMTAESKLSVSVLEAVPIEDLDEEAIKTGLAQYQAAYAAATDDLAKVEAEIGVDVYQAMAHAISEA